MQTLPLYRSSMSSKILFGFAVALGFAAVSTVFAASGEAATGAAQTSGTYLSSLDVNGDVTVVATDATTITLSWEKVAAATSYVVFYDTKSPDANDVDATYAKMSDPVTATGITLTGLAPNTAYFMMVLAMDANGNESSQGSKEVVAKTVGEAAFGLAENAVKVNSAKSVTLSFNKKLDAGKPVSVSVVANQDKSSVDAVATVNAADASKVDLALGSALAPSTYTVTVKLATSADGQNVQAGANAVQEFTYAADGSVAAPAPVADEADAAVATVLKDVPLNAAPVAAATKALPETGPAENVVVAMALVLGAVAVLVLRRRKSA